MARISIQCPMCGFQGKASEENIGKRARCRKCDKPFTVKPASSSSLSTEPDLDELARQEIDQQLKGRSPIPGMTIDELEESAEMSEFGEVIRFLCPYCRNGIVVDARRAGNKIQCKTCRQRVELPRRDLLGRLPGQPTDGNPDLDLFGFAQEEIVSSSLPAPPAPPPAPPPVTPSAAISEKPSTTLPGENWFDEDQVKKSAQEMSEFDEPIRFACGRCRRVIKVDASRVGQKLQCGNCGQRLEVPRHDPRNETMIGEPLGHARGVVRERPPCPIPAPAQDAHARRPHLPNDSQAADSHQPILILGVAGSAVLFLGVFMPIVSLPIFGSVNYFANGHGDGVIVLGLAFASLALTLTRSYRWLWLTGILSLGLMLFTFVNLQIGMSKTGGASAIEAAMARSIQLQWGWAVLVVGAVLILAAACKAELQRRDGPPMAAGPAPLKPSTEAVGSAGVLIYAAESLLSLIGLGAGLVVLVMLYWPGVLQRTNDSQDTTVAKQPTPNQPLEPTGAEPAPSAEREAVDASKWAGRVGDVVVDVARVEIGKVNIKGIIEDGTSKNELLKIKLTIKNQSKSNIVRYRSWAAETINISGLATLQDNFENKLVALHFGLFDKPVGQVKDVADIDPDTSLSDLLIFRKPLANTKYLILTLPGANVGAKGEVRLKIPASMIR